MAAWKLDHPTKQETVSSWTNPWTAEYKRRQAILTDMRPFEVIAVMRDLNLTSYAFSRNAEDLQAHVLRYLEIGQSQPFNPDVGDPFGVELARLLANLLASVLWLPAEPKIANRVRSLPSDSHWPPGS